MLSKGVCGGHKHSLSGKYQVIMICDIPRFKDRKQVKIDSKFFKRIAGIKTNVRLLNNVQEYIEVIDYLRESSDVGKPWYRGVSHAKYELIPKVYRDRIWHQHEDYEWWILVNFENRARPFISDHHFYCAWDWYFAMQHYGLPTRLLDWTEGSLIALYFAVRKPEETYIPSVYFMNPYWFDEAVYKKEEGDGVVYSTDANAISDEHDSRLSSYLGTWRESPPFPICIKPRVINNRIHAQKSVFTIHGKYFNPFRIVSRDNKNAQIAKIRFSTKKAAYIKNQLDGMGISEGTLFPGLEGLSRDLKHEFGIG